MSVFNRALGNLGGRPVGDLVRRPSRPWHWTIAFHRPTDEVATFKAQATSMLLLPARRSRPAATRRASCSALVPSVRPMHTHTNRPVNQFTTSATVNNGCLETTFVVTSRRRRPPGGPAAIFPRPQPIPELARERSSRLGSSAGRALGRAPPRRAGTVPENRSSPSRRRSAPTSCARASHASHNPWRS